MLKSKKIIFVLVGLFIVSAVFYGYKNKKQTQYLKAKKGDVLEAIYGLGKVQSDEVFELKIGIIANIGKLFVKEGDLVSKGAPMLTIEGVGSFKAPFDGTITFVAFKDGEIVTPQVPILRLENLTKKYIEVSLEQDAALKVRPGQQTKLIFQSLQGEPIEGLVEKIYPKKGDFIAHIEAEKIDSNVLPGMTADVVIEVGQKTDVLLIPVKAISSGRVVRKRNGKKQKVPVTIGHTDGLWTELVEGDILLTDELVVKGQ